MVVGESNPTLWGRGFGLRIQDLSFGVQGVGVEGPKVETLQGSEFRGFGNTGPSLKGKPLGAQECLEFGA